MSEYNEYGFIWQCPFETFHEKESFIPKLKEVFDKSILELIETNNMNSDEISMISDHKLLRLSIIVVRTATSQETYLDFQKDFLSIGMEPKDQHYYRKCMGKFYFNMDNEEIEEDKKLSKLKSIITTTVFPAKIMENFFMMLNDAVQNSEVGEINFDDFSYNVLFFTEKLKYLINYVRADNENAQMNNDIISAGTDQYILLLTELENSNKEYIYNEIQFIYNELNFIFMKFEKLNNNLLKRLYKIMSYKFESSNNIYEEFFANNRKFSRLSNTDIYSKVLSTNYWDGYLLIIDIIHRDYNGNSIKYSSYDTIYKDIIELKNEEELSSFYIF